MTQVVVSVDFSKHKKQEEFFMVVMDEVWKYENMESSPFDLRYFWLGGGIRGGKTYCLITILILLLRKYPGAKAHIIRASFPDLQRTAIPTAKKILKNSKGLIWRMNPSNCHVEFSNGSCLFFMAENISQDPDLDRFKGLETNFILLEQIEELQRETYDKCIERLGSEIMEPMPPPLLFSSFNPTHTWIKQEIHDKHEAGELSAPHYYMKLLPADSPFVTDEQWKNWQNMDPETYNRFINGSWDIPVEGQFCYAFSDKNLMKGLSIDPSKDIYLSFDFNVDPMTCLLIQTDGFRWSKVIKEYRIENSDTYEMCRVIKEDIGHMMHMVTVTGDASGKNRLSGTRGHINHYNIIMSELGLGLSQFKVPTVNPGISESRVFINSLLSRLPELFVDEEKCPYLVKDLRFCLADTDSQGKIMIQKTGKNKHAGMDNSQMGHLLDCFRYGHHAAFINWLEIPRS